MVVFRIFILYVLCLYPLSAENGIKFGLLYGKHYFTEKEARVGASLWLKTVEENDFGIDVEVVFYRDKEKIFNDYKNKKITSIVATGGFYYENKDFFDKNSSYKWIISRNNEMFSQYYLIKNKHSAFNIKNLKTKKILYKYDFQKIWIEKILLENNIKIKEKKFIFERKDTEKATVYDVFFDKEKISIVQKDTYESMLKLNPQLKEKLEVIKKSDLMFFRGIGFNIKGLSSKQKEVYEKIRKKILNKDIDFGILSYLQIQKTFVLKQGDLNKLDSFYEEYNKLKKEKSF